MSALVHIVLATYNGEQFIREQLDSVLASSMEDFSVEVCDDGSSDGTLSIVREYAGRDPRIRIHENKKNLGYMRNFLEGVRRSESPYIMLCDQDDVWRPDKIARTLQAMRELERECGEAESVAGGTGAEGGSGSGRPLLVFTDAENYDSDTGRDMGSFQQNSHLNTAKTDPAHLLMENKCIGCTVMVNAAVIPYLQTIPEEIRVHDWWLGLICSFFGKISFLPETTLQYRQHHGNMIGGNGFFEYVRDRVTKLREQRAALELTFAQGAAFYRLFGGQLAGREKLISEAFSKMQGAGFWRRRMYVLLFGFYKSGLTRNVALFLIL